MSRYEPSYNDQIGILSGYANVTVHASDFGVKGDKVTDDSAAISNAIQKALTALPINAINSGTTNGTHLVAEVVLPSGTFAIKNQIVVDGSQISTSMVDQITLKITGAGSGASVLVLQNNTGIFSFTNISLALSDIKFSGYGYTGSAFSLGSATDYKAVSASHFQRLQCFGFFNPLNINLLWDSTFVDCDFLAMQGTNPIGIMINTHPIDNTNNVNFVKCHIENTPNGTLLKMSGGTSTTTRHHDIHFWGSHLETHSYAATNIDIQNCQNIYFHGVQCTQNNDVGSLYSVTIANIVPMIRIQDAQLITFNGAMCSLNGANSSSALANKLIELGGATYGVIFDNIYLANGVTTGNQSINACIQQSGTNPLQDVNYASFRFRNVFINSLVQAPYNQERIYLSDPNLVNHNARIMYDGTEIQFAYSNDPKAQDASFNKVFGIYTANGIVDASVYTGQFCQTVVNGTSATLSIENSLNGNRRGMYLIYADYNADAFALIFSTGAALYPLFTGASAVVGNTDPGTSGKLNIFLTGTGITLFNRLGSDRRISIVPFGFR